MSDADLGFSGNARAKRTMNGHGRLPAGARIGPEHDDYLSPSDSIAPETYPGLISLSFIRTAIRRNVRVWCALGVVGLLAGAGLFVARPAGYQATTSLLMAQPPGVAPGWINDDQAVAQSRTVAGMALRRLGLHESPSILVGSYTVVAPTDRVLVLTVKASTARDALREAGALSAAFLTFQARMLNKQHRLVDAALQQQVLSARHQLGAINAQIAKVQSEPSSASQQAALRTLQAERGQASQALTQLKQTVTNTAATTEAATATAINDSVVLDPPALVKQSVKRRLALYGVGGLIGGLVLGIGIVVVTAIVSTRLRRRDDVARALAAPVRLSIGQRHLSRRRIRRQGLEAAKDQRLARVTRHLAAAVTPAASGFASLVVVAVDEVEVAAVCLASLGLSSAQDGSRVVMADLCEGAPGARLLGVTSPGVEGVTVDAARLVVMVPERDDVLPVGPLGGRKGRRADDALMAACASADIVLTLAALDPALGADHLAEWASSAVVLVTAGRSSAERIHAVGEMIRLAGIEQMTAVLLGADKSDESLGMPGPRVPARSRRGAGSAAAEDAGKASDLGRAELRGLQPDS